MVAFISATANISTDTDTVVAAATTTTTSAATTTTTTTTTTNNNNNNNNNNNKINPKTGHEAPETESWCIALLLL
jgi:hypothetical protein